MNLLFYRYGSICEPDLLQVWNRFGLTVYECDLEITNKSSTIEQRLNAVSEILCARTVDFVFSINYFPFLSSLCERLGMLYVCWSVDCPVPELFSSTIRNSCNRIFLFDYMQYMTLQAENPEHIFYLPLATNTDRWDEALASLTAEDERKYGSDVSFVGSLYHEKSPLSLLKPSPLPEFWQGFVNGICEAQLKVYGSCFLQESMTPELIQVLKQTFPDFWQSEDSFMDTDAYIAAHNYLGMRTSELERIRVLNELAASHQVALYTRSDTSLLRNVDCRGGVTTHIEMPKVFRLSKINLNITIKSIQSGLSLRVWDILGCGGFLLSNYQAEIPEYFELGKDLDCYESLADLKEKVAFYLTHDDIRREIAHNGYTKVKQQHTYDLRVAGMLKTLFDV